MRIGLTLFLGISITALVYNLVRADDFPASTLEPKSARTVQYFTNSGTGAPKQSSNPVTNNATLYQKSPSGTQTAIQPPEKDYYSELFGETPRNTTAGKPNVQVQQNKSMPSYPGGITTLPPSKSSSNLSAFDMLKNDISSQKHSSESTKQKVVNSSFQSGQTSLGSGPQGNIQKVVQFNVQNSQENQIDQNKPLFAPLNNQAFPTSEMLDDDEDLDADEDTVAPPPINLGQPVPTFRNLPPRDTSNTKAPPKFGQNKFAPDNNLFPGSNTQQNANVESNFKPTFNWSDEKKTPTGNNPQFNNLQKYPPFNQSNAQNKLGNTQPPQNVDPYANENFDPFNTKQPINTITKPVSQNPKIQPLNPKEFSFDESIKIAPKNPSFNTNNSIQNKEVPVKGVLKSLATAGPASPTMTIKWKKNSEVNVGQVAVCDLVVENSGNIRAENVVVEAQFPESIQLKDSDPAPEDARQGLIWSLGTMEAGSSKSIKITMVPLQNGDIAATAHVRFTGTTSGVFAVREPKLKTVIEGPKQVLLGDAAPHTVTVSNPGTGIANNVYVQTTLPEGLEHPKGKQLALQIGSLNPGETRTIRLSLTAMGAGTQPIQVYSAADGGLEDSATLALDVLAPSLELAVSGPGLRYKGRDAIYKLTIKNTGSIPTNNIKLMHKFPIGMNYVANDRGANYDKTTRLVNWFVGRLGSGESTTLLVKANSNEIGSYKHLIRVTSEQGTNTDAVVLTKVEGVASLSVDVADVDDPVEVGEETAYLITLTNEGSKEATNVVIDCDLPAGVELISAEGPTEYIADLDSLAFRPIKSVAPGKSAKCRLVVRGQVQGDARLKVKITSDSIADPILSEELTRFYGDQFK